MKSREPEAKRERAVVRFQPQRWWRWVAIATLVVLPFLVYLNCLHNEFVFDDYHLVAHNASIRGIHKLPDILRFDLKKGGSYRPVRMASYALDYSLNRHLWVHFERLAGNYRGVDPGVNPFGYHLANVVYHILTVLLVFTVINALSGDTRVAFLGAVLFSVHPVHSESVAYISGRRDVLSTLFYLLGFYLFIRLRVTGKWRYGIFFMGCYLLALGAKEMAVTLPLICFFYDVVRYLQQEGYRGRSSQQGIIFRALKKVATHHVYLYLAFFLVAVFVTYYKVWVKSPSQREIWYGENVLLHVLTMVKVLGHYLKLMFFPVTLVADYSYDGFPLVSSLLDLSVAGALLLLIFTGYGMWKLLPFYPVFSFGVLWWFVTLLPVCQIFPHHELMAEHYLYLPSVGLLLALALVLVRGAPLRGAPWLVVTMVMGIVVLFSVRVVARNGDWKDAPSLWEKTVKYVPRCVRAQNNLGVCYYTLGRYQEAKERHGIALRICPDHVESCTNLGNVCMAEGMYQEAENWYRKALEIDPSFEKAHSNLGMLFLKTGRYYEAWVHLREATRLNRYFAYPYYGRGLLLLLLRDGGFDSDRFFPQGAGEGSDRTFLNHLFQHPDAVLLYALNQFKKAVEYDPGFAEAYSNLASVYIMRSQYREAEEALLTALRLKPYLVEAHNNLIELYEMVGEPDKAIQARITLLTLPPERGENYYRAGVLYRSRGEYARALSSFEKACSLNYETAELHNELGILHRMGGRYQEAVKDLRKALSLSPGYAEAYYNLGLTYQSMGRDEEALAHYQQVVKLNPGFHQALNNMGSIYARRGDYDQAITLFTKVIELEPSSAVAHNNLGNAYRGKGRYWEAIKEYERAANLDVTYSDPDFNLGQLYLHDLHEVGKALFHYKRSIAINPGHQRVPAVRKKVEHLERMLSSSNSIGEREAGSDVIP